VERPRLEETLVQVGGTNGPDINFVSVVPTLPYVLILVVSLLLAFSILDSHYDEAFTH
jgi:hypothetical protein